MNPTQTVWSGDWKRRVRSRLHSLGCETMQDFLARFPGESYLRIAERLGDDIAAIQVEVTQYDEAKSLSRIRDAAKDSLVRDLNFHLPDGWRHGAKGDFETSGAYADWVGRAQDAEQSLRAKADAVWAVLERLHPPAGWKPANASDPTIEAAFAEGWPASSRRKVKRQQYGLLCPNCTAVLPLPNGQVNEIVCRLCGEQIELV
jgi:hypothetical protein